MPDIQPSLIGIDELLTPADELADVKAELGEKVIEVAAKDAVIASAAAAVDDLTSALASARLEAQSKQDKQGEVLRTNADIVTLRQALVEANQRIADLEDELGWRRDRDGEPVPEPKVGPPVVGQMEIPEHERRINPKDILPGRKG